MKRFFLNIVVYHYNTHFEETKLKLQRTCSHLVLALCLTVLTGVVGLIEQYQGIPQQCSAVQCSAVQ